MTQDQRLAVYARLNAGPQLSGRQRRRVLHKLLHELVRVYRDRAAGASSQETAPGKSGRDSSAVAGAVPSDDETAAGLGSGRASADGAYQRAVSTACVPAAARPAGPYSAGRAAVTPDGWVNDDDDRAAGARCGMALPPAPLRTAVELWRHRREVPALWVELGGAR